MQGAGHVGAALAGLLADDGAHVLIADIDPERARAVAAEVGGTAIDADAVLTVPCDVLAPCAVARVVSDATLGDLRCRFVAGAANDLLAAPGLAQRLADRDITYVPDFLANAGGVIHIHALRAGWDEAQLRAAVLRIGDRVSRRARRRRRRRARRRSPPRRSSPAGGSPGRARRPRAGRRAAASHSRRSARATAFLAFAFALAFIVIVFFRTTLVLPLSSFCVATTSILSVFFFARIRLPRLFSLIVTLAFWPPLSVTVFVPRTCGLGFFLLRRAARRRSSSARCSGSP